MKNSIQGLIAGFAGTLALSMLMFMKGMMGVMPNLDVIGMLSTMMNGTAVLGWMGHFLIGTVVWGLGFALLHDRLPGRSSVQKGVVFGTAAWVLMMLVVMPMAGAGVMGLGLGLMAPIMTFMLHAVFGAVLGFVFGRLTRSSGDSANLAASI